MFQYNKSGTQEKFRQNGNYKSLQKGHMAPVPGMMVEQMI